MSIENAKAFYGKVRADRGLQREIGESAKANPAEREAVILKVAGAKGYSFTVEEMRTALKETAAPLNTGELQDEELEAVAGGGSKLENWWTSLVNKNTYDACVNA